MFFFPKGKQVTKADVVHPLQISLTVLVLVAILKTVTTCMGTDWKQILRSAYTYMGMLCKVLISSTVY